MEGLANLITRLALNFKEFNDNMAQAADDFLNGFYGSAGQLYGEILSILLGFKI
jgi:hypothetical protein